MSNYRYSFSFVISTIVFTLIGFSLFLFSQEVKSHKEIKKEVIKIAIIKPPSIKKKVEEKKVEPKAISKPIIVPPMPLVQKVHKKIKPKRVIKKRRKIVKKKKVIRKKRVIKKRRKIVKKKKVIKRKKTRRVVKKVIPKKRSVVKKVVRREVPQPQVVEEFYIPPQPIITPKIRPRPQTTRQVVAVPKKQVEVKVDKSRERRAFLNQIRGKIITNKKYPKMALRRHIQGSVTVKFDIDIMGNVKNIRFLNGKTILQKSVKNAIERSFPVNIPHNLKSELPIDNISVKIHFNIN